MCTRCIRCVCMCLCVFVFVVVMLVLSLRYVFVGVYCWWCTRFALVDATRLDSSLLGWLGGGKQSTAVWGNVSTPADILAWGVCCVRCGGVCVSVWVSPDVSGVYLRYFTTVFYTHTKKFFKFSVLHTQCGGCLVTWHEVCQRLCTIVQSFMCAILALDSFFSVALLLYLN